MEVTKGKKFKTIYHINNKEQYEIFLREKLYPNLKSIDNIFDILPDFNKIDKIPITNLLRLVKSNITSAAVCKKQSQWSREYWWIRGYDDDEIKENISHAQKKNSPRSKEYWLSRGYTEEDAGNKVIETQSRNGKLANKPFTMEYWSSMGYTEEESKEMIKQQCENRSSFNQKFWVNRRGYTEKEATEKVRENADTNSLPKFIQKYGETEGKKLYNKRCEKMSEAMMGEKNPQYGIPSPNGTGRGISGYYKNYYFRSTYEYFFIKQCERNGISFVCNDVAKNRNENKVVIEYTDPSGTKRNYIPDFIINGDTIVEVKSVYGFGTVEWKQKLEATKKYIDKSSKYVSIECVSNKDIEIDPTLLEDDYHNKLVTIDKGKIARFQKGFKINEDYFKKESPSQKSI